MLCDLDEGRIADMDKHGITVQVLSNLSTQQVPADVAADLVRSANDTLAAAVRRHPSRFAAFAALPTTVPGAAAAELERCVGDLGFVGTMIMGRTEGEFLSAERFDPILRTAARLSVPIYLHPALPTRVTSAISGSFNVRRDRTVLVSLGSVILWLPVWLPADPPEVSDIL